MMMTGKEKTQIPRNSELFGEIEYFLKLSLKSTTAKITSCFLLSNPHLTEPFVRISKQNLTLQSLVDSARLVGANVEEDVIKRGFSIPASGGLEFTVGSFLPASLNQAHHRALICDIVVGRSYSVDKEAIESTKLPEGYCSYYIADEKNAYSHSYFIKSSNYVLPKYLIQYEYDVAKEEKSRQKPNCEDCENELAIVYCEADRAYLCSKCDQNLHKTKITKSHHRTPVGHGTDVFGNCEAHPTRQIQYFCSQCHVPICIDCTVMGSHAKAELGKHTLVSVEDYLKTVTEESKLVNPLLQRRLVDISSQIGDIQSRADSVVEMGKQITSRIDDICAQAKRQCEFITEKKLTVLLGDEQELRRQAKEIEFLDNYLKYQQEGDSMQCVYTWHIHRRCQEKLADFEFFRKDIDVQLDAKINGSLTVIEDKNRVTGDDTRSPTRQSSSPVKSASPLKQSQNLTPRLLDSSPKRPTVAPHQFSESPTPSAPYALSAENIVTSQNYSPFSNLGVGSGFPKSTNLERKTERRISDFFHEALNFGSDNLDQFDSKFN